MIAQIDNCFQSSRCTGNSTDLRLNSELAGAVERAKRANVPKETIERAMKRAVNAKIVNVKVELAGPNQLVLILNMETDSKSRARHDIKALIKKHRGYASTAGARRRLGPDGDGTWFAFSSLSHLV